MSKLVESIHAVDEDEALEAHRFDANNLQMSRLDISLPSTPENIDDHHHSYEYKKIAGVRVIR